MPNVIELDFRDAPPAQGRNVSDRVPPGRYGLVVSGVDSSPSKKGKPMATMTFRVDDGASVGKKFIERFTFPTTAEDSKFGLQRFHAMLVALGVKQQTKKISLDIDSLVGKRCLADVDDEETAATDQYEARVSSRIMEFHSMASGNNVKAAPKAASVPSPIAEAVEAAELEAEPEPELEAESVTAELADLFE